MKQKTERADIWALYIAFWREVEGKKWTKIEFQYAPNDKLNWPKNLFGDNNDDSSVGGIMKRDDANAIQFTNVSRSSAVCVRSLTRGLMQVQRD